MRVQFPDLPFLADDVTAMDHPEGKGSFFTVVFETSEAGVEGSSLPFTKTVRLAVWHGTIRILAWGSIYRCFASPGIGYTSQDHEYHHRQVGARTVSGHFRCRIQLCIQVQDEQQQASFAIHTATSSRPPVEKYNDFVEVVLWAVHCTEPQDTFVNHGPRTLGGDRCLCVCERETLAQGGLH